MLMQSAIILIGPSHVGKSTVGKLLAARLERTFVDLARVAAQYYAELGHDWEAARQAWEEGSFAGFLHYQAPFDVHAVERGLHAHAGGMIELGAFQVAVDDDALLERVRRALSPSRLVVLLLPSADADVSVRVLDERSRVLYDGMELNEHFVRHHS